jgi:hypothetical protein
VLQYLKEFIRNLLLQAALFIRRRLTPVEKSKECKMAGNQGGSHEQHVKAGEQSHKNAGSGSSSQGGAHEQHGKAGEPNHKNAGSGSSSRGGSQEQHLKAGGQSHKNK